MSDGTWMTIPEAARSYGVSENAIRQRLKRRNFANTERRSGIIYVLVPNSDQSQLVPIEPAPTQLADRQLVERLAAALEQHNALLEQLLAEPAEPAPKKRRWPWQHE